MTVIQLKRKYVSSKLQRNCIEFSGKTCLVRRFTQGVFPPGQGATIGVDFMIKTVVVDNEKIKVNYVNNKLLNSNFNAFLLFIPAPDMGHGWPRKISIDYSKVKSISNSHVNNV